MILTSALHTIALIVLGAIQLASELSPEQTVVTVAADTGLKYLAGDLYL